MKVLIAFAAGIVFGFGLIISGMSNPSKVLGFLDLAGAWDPSLALVMAGAIGTAVLPFRWAKRRTHALLGAPIPTFDNSLVDLPLVLGGALFGVGWGLAGFCPGPGIVGTGAAYLPAMVFSFSMVVGIVVKQRVVDRFSERAFGSLTKQV